MRLSGPSVVLVAILVGVAPRLAGAQLGPPPIPRSTHTWLGIGAGVVAVGSARRHHQGTAGAFRADIATRVAPYTMLDVDGYIFARVNEARINCAASSAGPSDGCGATLHVNPRDAITATLGREVGEVHGTPMLVLGGGAGAYRVHDYPGWYLSLHAAAKIVIVDFGHVALTAAVQPTLLPNIAGGHLWLVPITFGVRAH